MTLLSKCVEGHQTKNRENEGIRGGPDGVFGGHTGAAHPSPSKWSHYQQEEGVLSCFFFFLLLVVCHSWGSVNTVYVYFQNASTEPGEDVISLSEILEVSLTLRNLLSGVLLNLNVMFNICVVIFLIFLTETQH